MSVTQTNRDIDSLLPIAQKAIRLFFQECHKAGIKIFVTETYRSQGRQNYLYEQGRSRAGNIVTWTKSSRHTSKLAWDIAASTLGGNTNIYNTTIIKKAGAIANKLGITWGGNWKNNLDYPHFEITSKWTIPKGYALEGKVSIPTRSNVPISIVGSISQLPKVELNVSDDKLEEELKLSKYIPTLKDCTAPTLRTRAIQDIKKGLELGIINGKHWLEAAEDGSLTIADYSLLMNFMRGPIGTPVPLATISDVSSNTLKNSIIDTLVEAEEAQILNNSKWVNDAKAGTLTMVDYTALENHIARHPKG